MTDPADGAKSSAAPSGEGTIQFAYDLRPPTGPALALEHAADLAAWRELLRRLDLLGQCADRYDNLGFGNISIRDPDEPDGFRITASQTSGLPQLGEDDLIHVRHCNIERFWVEAEGSAPPSSETLTHAMLYAADPRIRWVLHVHSPDIWQATEALKLPATPADVSYGSPAMAAAVAALLQRHHSRPLLFTTLGHEDGVFACGATARDAGIALVNTLARALVISRSDA